MNYIKIGNMTVSEIAVGCMRIGEMEHIDLCRHILGCLEMGLNFFDHADIYGGGECERAFGKAMKKLEIPREDYFLQSKCGIVPNTKYDLSKCHILDSVDGILKRLDTDYIDILLLHRPDALCRPEEVASAFDALYTSGKVRNFGVSNHNPMQIELLKKYCRQDIIVNQLQLSLPFASAISEGMEVNMQTEGGVNRDGCILDYCRLNDIAVQAWSPFQYGTFEGTFIDNFDKFPELNYCLDELAERYMVTPTAIAAAWLFRHPANIQLIAGTTKLSRLKEIIDGCDIRLNRDNWYKLYLAAGHILP